MITKAKIMQHLDKFASLTTFTFKLTEDVYMHTGLSTDYTIDVYKDGIFQDSIIFSENSYDSMVSCMNHVLDILSYMKKGSWIPVSEKPYAA